MPIFNCRLRHVNQPLQRLARLWVILMLTGLASHPASAEDMNLIVTLDHADLQRRIERLFPIHRENELLSVRLYHPQVILPKHGNRIGLRLQVDATAADQFSLTGLAGVDGVIRYASANGAFYLDDASVEKLQIDGVPPIYVDQIRQIADGVIRDILKDTPIYTLGQHGEPKRIMGSKLKSVTVRDGKLIMELEMP